MDGRLKKPATDEKRNGALTSQASIDDDDLHLLPDSASVGNVEHLLDIKIAIRRSIDDPRPSLSLEQVDDFIDALVHKAKANSERA